jgi:hypothetical protein
MKKLWFLPLFFCLGASATNYYVSPYGNDANDGTSISTPWKTISKINKQRYFPGDIIMFQRGGVWRETLFGAFSGSEGKPITFSSYGSGAKPIINGANVYSGWSRYKDNIWSRQSPLANNTTLTIMVDGSIYSRVTSISSLVENTFYINKNSNPDQIYIYSKNNLSTSIVEISTRQYGIFMSRKSHIVISNLDLMNCLYAGLRLDGQGLYDGNPRTYFNGYTTVDGVCASNSVSFGIVTGNGYSYTTIKNSSAYSNGNGFYSDGNANNTTFQKDTAYNNYNQTDPFTDGNGFGVYKSSFNTVENCVSYGNQSGCGIEVDLENTDSSIVIRYNTVYGNGTSSEGYGIKTGNVTGKTSNLIYYNLSYLNGNDPNDKMGREFYSQNGNVSYYNNTAYTTGLSAYGITIAGTGTVVVKNNIIFSHGGLFTRCIRRLNSAVLIADRNLYYSTAPAPFFDGSSPFDFLNWKKVGNNDVNSLRENPLFTIEGSHFSLRSESPAVNKGSNVGLTKDILGNPIVGLPDMGAYELPAIAQLSQANALPFANAGPNRLITLPTNSADLNGSASYDRDGVIKSYVWRQVKGPSNSTLSSNSTPNIKVSNLVEGVYTYKLTVRDDDKAKASATVTVTIVKNKNKATENAKSVATADNETRKSSIAIADYQMLTDKTLPNQTTLNEEALSDANETKTSFWQHLVRSSPSGSSLTKLDLQANGTTTNKIVKESVIDNLKGSNTFLTIYPNPVAHVLNVRLPTNAAKKAEIIIFDITGRKVMTTVIADKLEGALSIPVDVAKFAKGTYSINVLGFAAKNRSTAFIKL